MKITKISGIYINSIILINKNFNKTIIKKSQWIVIIKENWNLINN